MSARGPSEAPKGSAAEPRRRARASGGGPPLLVGGLGDQLRRGLAEARSRVNAKAEAPRALRKEVVWQSDEDAAEERAKPAAGASNICGST